MPPEPIDSVLNAFVGVASLLSISTLAYLVAAWRRGPWLPYEPRRPVPWNAAGSILAIVFVVMALSSPFAQQADKPVAAEQGPANQVVTKLVANVLPELFIVGGFVFVVAVLSHATPRDFGLPANAEQTARDITIGVVACLAGLAPVHLAQVLMMYAMGRSEEESAHPLVKLITEREPNVGLFLLIAVAAVIVAPLCEEFIFRVLLQGWLEKWEDRRLGWRDTSLQDAEQMTNDECQMTNEEPGPSDNSSFDIRHSSLDEPAQPPARGIAGLPHGWVPVITSALFFGLAHFGYGPEPVPLFFLGLILGYVYHRTHRVLPCIVAHAMFNFFTVFVLWRTVFFNA